MVGHEVGAWRGDEGSDLLDELECQAIQPRFKAICEAHGVPYLQESVFTRTAKTLAVLTGVATMPVWPAEISPRPADAPV